jgi:hypothetical protein
MTSGAQLLPGNFFILGNLTFFSFPSTCDLASRDPAHQAEIDRFQSPPKGVLGTPGRISPAGLCADKRGMVASQLGDNFVRQ